MSVKERRFSIASITSLNDDGKFDQVIEKIGTKGPFQKKFNFMYNFLLVTATAMPYLNIILVLAVPDHWCHVPGRENTNYTIKEWKKLTLPITVDTKGRLLASKCEMYNASYEELLYDNSSNFEIVGCQHGWEYDKTWYTETAPSQEDWVCEKELFVSNIFAVGRIGDVIGTFTFGQLGDLIGRRPVYYITLGTLVLGRTLGAFTAHNFSLFMFATLLGSLSSTAVFQAPLIIAMEIANEKERAHIAMMQLVGWTFGMSFMPFIFWWVGHWFYFMLATTLPCLLFFFPYRNMIESPRWLASQGKTEKCINALKIIAKDNKTSVPADAMNRLRKDFGKGERSFGVMSLFSSWRLAKNTIMLLLCWITGATTYFVIVLNVNSLAGNPFINFFVQGIVELPAYILGRILSDRFGRRFTQIIPFFLAALTCIPIVDLITDPTKEVTISYLASLIKFWVSVSFYGCNLLTLEMFPTCVRQSGLALGCISGSAFGILGPYIVYLGTSYDARYPFYIIAVSMLLGAVAAVFLPETLHQKLPETLADAHNFGKDQSYFSFPKKPVKKANTLLRQKT